MRAAALRIWTARAGEPSETSYAAASRLELSLKAKVTRISKSTGQTRAAHGCLRRLRRSPRPQVPPTSPSNITKKSEIKYRVQLDGTRAVALEVVRLFAPLFTLALGLRPGAA